MLVSEIALVVTAIGVLGIMLGLRQDNLERLGQMEAMYVKRYWTILGSLSVEALAISDLAPIGQDDEWAMRSDFMLSEDELEMRQAGYVTNSTYLVWAEGMRGQLDQPMFQKIWAQVLKEAEDRSTFPYEHLRRLLSAADAHAGDPLSMWWMTRRVRGLAGRRRPRSRWRGSRSSSATPLVEAVSPRPAQPTDLNKLPNWRAACHRSHSQS